MISIVMWIRLPNDVCKKGSGKVREIQMEIRRKIIHIRTCIIKYIMMKELMT